jgi:hypothetical protein
MSETPASNFSTDVQRGRKTHRPRRRKSAVRLAGRNRFGPQQMRQTTTGEVRFDEGNATSSSAARRATRRFSCEQRRLRWNCVAATPPRGERKSRSPAETGRSRMRKPGTGLERELRAKRALRGRKSSEFERPGRGIPGSARLRRHSSWNIVVREAEKADHPRVR